LRAATVQMTILTPYTGQVFLIRRLLRQRPTLHDVRLCPIDNYQGEENDIVLLSLVRSSAAHQLKPTIGFAKPTIGFVRDENRICVALSRARVGLYVVGNLRHLARNSELWSKMVQQARESRSIGDSLRLACQNHPNEAQIDARSVYSAPLIGPISWGHSGPLCHALSSSSSWTSHAACAIAIAGVRQ